MRERGRFAQKPAAARSGVVAIQRAEAVATAPQREIRRSGAKGGGRGQAGPVAPVAVGRGGLQGRSVANAGAERRSGFAQLEGENRQLRVELGQATYKIKQLSKLREQHAESERKELIARQNEARAIKELDLAKEYVGKRDSFARSEKAELMQQVKHLEETLAQITGREDGLQAEIAEATHYRQEAAQHVQDAKKMTERWRTEAEEQSKHLKHMEQRLKQLEEKRQQDKVRLREFSELLKEQRRQDNLQDGSVARPESQIRPQSKANRNGSADDGSFRVEEPVKPNNGRRVNASANDSAGMFAGLWRRTIQPLLLRGVGSFEDTGSSSGAPGRGATGKGKKSGREAKCHASGGEAALDEALEAAAEVRRQQMILGALVVLIAALAVTKIALT